MRRMPGPFSTSEYGALRGRDLGNIVRDGVSPSILENHLLRQVAGGVFKNPPG